MGRLIFIMGDCIVNIDSSKIHNIGRERTDKFIENVKTVNAIPFMLLGNNPRAIFRKRCVTNRKTIPTINALQLERMAEKVFSLLGLRIFVFNIQPNGTDISIVVIEDI